MAAAFRLRRAPQCLGCLRSFVEPENTGTLSLFNIQTRGKKTKRKLPPRVNVKLLEDIAGYGRKGSVMPVAPGRMRNLWYPRHKAQYMTATQLAESNDRIVERDPTFGMKIETANGREEIKEIPVPISVKHLSPERSRELLDMLIPNTLDFHRTPISVRESTNVQASELDRPIVHETTSVSGNGSDPQTGAIYGSVSATDIVARINELVSLSTTKKGFEDVSRVVVGPEDIRIVRSQESIAGVEVDRVKVLGDFDFDVQIKGGQPIRRKLRVNLLRA